MTENRLIEDFIPIREISVEAAREKSIRKGHISTLHLWWARRPLVAARAAVFASLVAAPETPQQRTALSEAMIDLCRWQAGETTIKAARKQILEAQRQRLNLPDDTPLNQVPPPKVLDMFAGGGAIPLEALRLGCETYAVELNPVAYIIELCTLVYPQKYEKKLASEVEKWGNWVIVRVREEIGDLYPAVKVGEVVPEEYEQLELLAPQQTNQFNLNSPEKGKGKGKGKGEEIFTPNPIPSPSPSWGRGGSLTPVAYLWTRTVQCPNPACGASVPLVRQTWLCKKSKKYVALKVIPNHDTKLVEFEVVEATAEKDLGFDPAVGSERGNSTCRHCGTTVKKDYVKEQGKAGNIGQQLIAIVCTTPGTQGKTYLAGKKSDRYIPDEAELKNRLAQLCAETNLTIPSEPIFCGDTRAFFTHLYGLDNFGKLFTSRQLLSLMTFVKWVRLAHQEMLQLGYDVELGRAIATYLGIMCDRLADYNSSITHWHNSRELIGNTFARQALPMVWDFTEINPLGNASGNAKSALDWILQFIKQESNTDSTNVENKNFAFLQRGSAMSCHIESDSLDAVITDPPYFDSVPYADLSDFFYVWLKRSIGHLYPEHFSSQLTPKKNEAIMEPSRHGGNKAKAAQAYEDMMHQAFCEASRVLKPRGMMVVVYAHKTTSGWVTLIDSLRRAGFTITEAWPLDTEMGSRLRSQNSAALASSIFLVARKRTELLIGDYATEVRPQLAEIVSERVKTLIAEGVSGADLVIACIGAGLRAYTQFSSVELPNGDSLDASTFLDAVQKEVLDAILTDVLLCDSKGVSALDKPTQYYILARYEYGEAVVEFDEANTLARGVGVELSGVGGLTDGKLSLVKKDKTKIQLRDYSQRGASEDLGIQKTEKQQSFNVKPEKVSTVPSIIDILHRLLWLLEHQPQEIYNFIALVQPDTILLRMVAQALAGRTLTPQLPTLSLDSGEAFSLDSGEAFSLNSGEAPGESMAFRTQEQQAIDTLLASWKRVIEDNLFTQG